MNELRGPTRRIMLRYPTQPNLDAWFDEITPGAQKRAILLDWDATASTARWAGAICSSAALAGLPALDPLRLATSLGISLAAQRAVIDRRRGRSTGSAAIRDGSGPGRGRRCSPRPLPTSK